MIKEKVEKIINEQIEKEAYSSNLYLAMASWAETSGYEGVSNWLHAQANEERMHMLKFISYVNERGGKAVIPAIKKPPVAFKTVHDMFKQVLTHEEYITDSINEIVATCIEQKDFSTQNWVQWFVTEQIEEEKSVRAIIDKLSLVGKNNDNLYLFDKDILGMRGTATAAE
ncbi:MAG TPA: ferritin [Bacteroidales bacterium]|nr:MAG: ferritin [Bacteroidetes bacterium GWF2_33_38]OFY76715.1 MAG: ferritin [Bacteroidetes bacterium RIFOXYA12_FULL_33_9]HBF87139.1 ferritin [Bacteroidales bacterium]